MILMPVVFSALNMNKTTTGSLSMQDSVDTSLVFEQASILTFALHYAATGSSCLFTHRNS
jgi:hypothetical protein